jgi:hypothetical protein
LIEYLNEIYKLETESYPEDEAATLEKIKYRINNTKNFLAMFNDENEIIGFINGTKSKLKHLNHESMSKHEPDGGIL